MVHVRRNLSNTVGQGLCADGDTRRPRRKGSTLSYYGPKEGVATGFEAEASRNDVRRSHMCPGTTVTVTHTKLLCDDRRRYRRHK